MKRYEGLFILDLTGREDGVNEAIEKVKSILTGAGAKVETSQNLGKKPFVRVTDKKVTGGHYVNFLFEAGKAEMAALPLKFTHVSEVYRVLFNEAGKTPLPVPAAVPAV